MRVVVDTPIGKLTVGGDEAAVTEISFGTFGDNIAPEGAVLQAVTELKAYFAGELEHFSFPMAPKGTAFQLAVWQGLTQIPYGQVQTYGELAKQLGNPGASRAVGMAAHRNPIAIAIPCHRLVGKSGLTGYAGGLDKKKWLLEHENCAIPTQNT